MADGNEAGGLPDPAFEQEVLEGLSKPQKSISPKWLYDQRGSELFEQITGLDEYYPTRTETAILKAHAPAMAKAIGSQGVIVEYGAGAAVKTRLLLDALDAPRAYAPIDISEAFLTLSAATLAADYPELDVVPVIGSFLDPIDLSALPAGRRCGFFPGSTIGNLTDPQIETFFKAARTSLGPDGQFLLGVDLVKSPDILVPAYDDAKGVTAAFILNVLTRMNRELGADFDMSQFAFRAIWNAEKSQIEMSIVSQTDQIVTVAGKPFQFAKGERLETSHSRKFTLQSLSQTLARSGWSIAETWQDERAYFCVARLAPQSLSR